QESAQLKSEQLELVGRWESDALERYEEIQRLKAQLAEPHTGRIAELELLVSNLRRDLANMGMWRQKCVAALKLALAGVYDGRYSGKKAIVESIEDALNTAQCQSKPYTIEDDPWLKT